MLKIGDFSRLGQVSVKTLRFYNEIGLLKPTYVDHLTGYRYYALSLLPRLNRILAFKELGFSLEEILLLLPEHLSSAQVRRALQHKRTELSSKLARDQARLAQIEEWLNQIEEGTANPNYEILLRQLPPQRVASVRDHIASYDEAAELFAEVDHHLRKYNASGQHAAIWHTCAGQGKQIDCEAAVFLNDFVPNCKRVRVYELPASQSACIIHKGGDDTANQAYVAVRLWIEAHHHTISGPCRELYWHENDGRGDSSNLTEIQYPIHQPQSVTPIGNCSV